MAETGFFNKDAWRALAVAILVVVAGQLFLFWQYQRLEKERIPNLEQKVAEQREMIEKKNAQETLSAFLAARIGVDEAKASQYLTEKAMAQKDQGDFVLLDDFKSYEIKKEEKTGEGIYRFQVTLARRGQIAGLLEIITLKKILENYYVDSVELAG